MKKIISILLTICLMISLMTGLDIKVQAATTYTSGDYTYSLDNNGNATITKYSGSELDIIIPNKFGENYVTRIDQSAFENTKIKSIELPEGLTYIGYDAFSGTQLTSITIPKKVTTASLALRGTAITDLYFEEGMETVPGSIAESCTTLKNIHWASSITGIEGSAFLGCSEITEIQLPEGLERIDQSAFENTKIKSIELPEGLTYIGYDAFSGTQLTSITIPKKVTTASLALRGTAITDLYFEEGMETVPGSIAESCTTLKNIHWASSITRIEESAFKNCSNLESIEMNCDISNIGSDVFSGCDNLLLLCNYYTYPVVYSIDNNIKFAPSGTKFVDTENKVLDRKKSNFYANMDSVSANGYLPMTINFNVKNKWKGELSNQKIVTYIPQYTDLIEDSIKLDGKFITDYSYNESKRQLIISVNADSGLISYDIRIKSKENITSYAYLTVRKNGTTVIENIDAINEAFSGITLSVPNVISKNKVEVSGIAPVTSKVDIYVDGVKQNSVISLKNGSWSSDIEISNPVDYYSYTVEAKSIDEYDADISAMQYVSYEEKAPYVDGLTLEYNEHEKIKEYDLLKSTYLPKIYYLPGTEFKFKASIRNDEIIDKVFITSTRNNEKKYLEAKYNEATGKYVAEGYFDPDNVNYVPGKIGIEFIKNNKKVDVSDKFDLTQYQTIIGEDLDKTKISYEINDKEEVLATVNLSDVVKDMTKASIKAHIKYNDKVKGTSYEDLYDIYGIGKNFYKYLVPDEYGNQYIMTMDYSDPDNIIMLVYDTVDSGITVASQAIEFNLNMKNFGSNEYIKLYDLKDKIGNFSKAASFAYKTYGIYSDYYDLIKEIDQSSIIDNKFEAKQKALELRQDQMAFLALTTVLPMLVAGSTMAAPVLVFSLIIGAMTSLSDVFWSYRVGQIKAGSFNMKWVVDPSGYVYDKITTNRIEGAIVTAYWIPYDESDEFWINKPSNDAYGILWDAIEYEQENPLKTNVDGKYAWDVPEGWWRVKCEAEGYNAVWSDWMTVPPIQTDVNIAMSSDSKNEEDKSETPDTSDENGNNTTSQPNTVPSETGNSNSTSSNVTDSNTSLTNKETINYATKLNIVNKKSYSISKKITIKDKNGIKIIKLNKKTIKTKGKKSISFKLSKYKKHLKGNGKWNKLIITDMLNKKKTIKFKMK